MRPHLPELIVTLSLTEVDGTIDKIFADLQAAGYTKSTRKGNTVSMYIPVEDLPPASGYLAWDFREFDGTTNATVSAVAFRFSKKGTMISVM